LDNSEPRLQNIDREWALQLVQFLDQQIAIAAIDSGTSGFVQAAKKGIDDLQREMKRKEDAAGASQVQYALLAGYYKDLALLRYVIGSHLNMVRADIATAAQAYWHVFRLRGTSPAFSAEIVTLHDRPTGDETDHIERRELHDADEMDYSLTNSRTGLLAMYLAVIGEGQDMARRIAELVWDPPDANYIAPESVICTPDEQHLAYALKAYILGQDDRVLPELDLIRESGVDVRSQAMILRAIHSRNAQSFLEELSKQLAWHLKQAQRSENQKTPEYFLDIPGLALYALALHASIILPGQKPDDIYLPVELLSTE
jgi:hypothetical protein